MKVVIALPEAAPITEQYDIVSAGTLFVQHSNYEIYDSLEDAWIEYTSPSTFYFSVKTGQISTTLPLGATQMADGAIVTLVQGNGGA